MALRDRNHWKIAVIGLMSVLAAAAFGWFCVVFVGTNSIRAVAGAFAAGVMYLAAATVRALVVDSKRVAAAMIACDALLFLTPFLQYPSPWLIITGAIGGMWLWYAHMKGKAALDNMVRVRMRDLSRPLMLPAFKALLFIAIASCIAAANPATLTVSRRTAIAVAEQVLAAPVKNAAARIAGPNMSDDQIRASIAAATGAAYDAAAEASAALPMSFGRFAIAAVGIVAFLLAIGFIAFIMPVVIGAIWIVVRLLLKTGFITIKTQTAERTTISL
jgi:hypothetical protein